MFSVGGNAVPPQSVLIPRGSEREVQDVWTKTDKKDLRGDVSHTPVAHIPLLLQTIMAWCVSLFIAEVSSPLKALRSTL